jgi:O-methyltransferase involved in polyketide biosynthesis
MASMPLPGALDALAATCASRPTTIVCEGVLMYLPKSVVVRALRTLAALPEPPRLLFTVLDTLQPGGRGFRRRAPWVRRWLDRQGEPFRWRCSPSRVRRCLTAAGYMVAEHWDGEGYGEYGMEAIHSMASSAEPDQPCGQARDACRCAALCLLLSDTT